MESIAFSSPWAGFGCPAPYTTIYTGEILFVQQWIIWERISMVSVPLLFYDIEQKNFRWGEVTVLPKWLSSHIVETRCVRVHMESTLQLGTYKERRLNSYQFLDRNNCTV